MEKRYVPLLKEDTLSLHRQVLNIITEPPQS